MEEYYKEIKFHDESIKDNFYNLLILLKLKNIKYDFIYVDSCLICFIPDNDFLFEVHLTNGYIDNMNHIFFPVKYKSDEKEFNKVINCCIKKYS